MVQSSRGLWTCKNCGLTWMAGGEDLCLSVLGIQGGGMWKSSASVGSTPFLSFIEPVFAWNVPLVSLIFLKRSLVFPILLFSSISLNWTLRKAFLSLIAVLWSSAFKWVYFSFSPLPLASLLFSTTCKAYSDRHLSFLHFFFWGDGFDPCLLYNVMNICP